MASRLPQIDGLRAIRALSRAGWEVVRIHGSHHIMKHAERPSATLVVPGHRRSLKKGTLADILEQAGLTVEEFKGLL